MGQRAEFAAGSWIARQPPRSGRINLWVKKTVVATGFTRFARPKKWRPDLPLTGLKWYKGGYA